MDVYVMTGPIQTGKTTWVGKMLARAEERGLKVTGVWTPAVFEDGVKTAIDAQLLPAGERFQFAVPRKPDASGAEGKPDGRKRLGWSFHDDAMARINEHLRACADDLGDLFVVDEFGALEFYQNKGYVEGLKIMDAGLPSKVLLVLRSDLVEPAALRWGTKEVLHIDADIDAFLDETNQP